MKNHIGDLVVDELLRRLALARKITHKEYKSTKPFRMEPVSNDEMLRRYESTTPEQWAELANTQSPDDMEDYRNKMENLKIRRGDYA